MPELLDESTSLESTTIGVYRTAATVKGGRRFSFGALVVVGNRNGQVGYGYAKANEVPNAIEKAQKYAKRKLLTIPRIGGTFNHEVEGVFSASKVRLVPASPGTGVVAGTVVRSILELAGVTDALSKCYGSTNARNVVKAVFAGLDQLQTPSAVAGLRRLTLERTQIEDRIEKGRAFMPKMSGKEQRARGPVNTIGSERKGRGGNRPRRRGPEGEQPSAPAGDSGAAPAQG